MSYPANAEQGQRMIDAAGGNPVAPAGDVTRNRSPFNAEQAEELIELLRSGGGGGGGGGTWGNITGTLSNQTDLSNALNAKAEKVPAVYAYDGADLSTVFSSAAALHTAIAAGDFSKIHIGDYWPITLSGTFHDAAADSDKSINTTVRMEVAAINPYIRQGNADFNTQHVLLCSRDALPPTPAYRSAAGVWFDATQDNPWRGSAMWETLNNAENGLIKLVKASTLGSIVYDGPNGKGIIAFLPTMGVGAGSPSTPKWVDRGQLFFPTETEVYGTRIYSSNSGYEIGSLYNQWPIFAGSSRHIIKGSGDGGSRCTWWLQSATSSTNFATVNVYGYPDSAGAAYDYLHFPLCFIIT